MRSEVQVLPGVTTAVPHGDLDMATVEDLRALLEEVADTGSGRVVIDLCNVPFVDVQSLSVILATADGLRESGRQLVVAGASRSVRRLCALLNADDVLAPALPLQRLSAVPPL